MRYVLFTLLAVTTSVAFAQRTPQLTWEGHVRGGAGLNIHGDQVDVNERETGSVESPKVSLRQPLPASAQTVQVQVRTGRGRVRVVEQPAPENEYTAVVRIEPAGNQHELYRIDFFWNASANASREPDYANRGRQGTGRQTGEMTWSGKVDREAIVEVRAKQVNVRAPRGRKVVNASAQFSAPLPRHDSSNVRLDPVNGRGQVRLLKRPTAENDYTAVVRILDPKAGAQQYTFRLVWDGE